MLGSNTSDRQITSQQELIIGIIRNVKSKDILKNTIILKIHKILKAQKTCKILQIISIEYGHKKRCITFDILIKKYILSNKCYL